MDPDHNEQKKLADLRKQLTPGGDDSADDVGSEQDETIHESKFISSFKGQQVEKQQLWEDTQVRESGQTQSLQPLAVEQQPKDEVNQETEVNEKQTQQKQEPSKKRQQNQKILHDRYFKQIKSYAVPYDSKFIFAAFELLFPEFKTLINPQLGFIKFSPYINTKQIVIYYYDDKGKDTIAEIVDDNINELEVMEMSKNDAESGIQLSFKYRQQLMQQKISFFKDRTQNFKNASYYICGKVSKNVLYQKISQIKKMNFVWMHLFRFESTRSYRAILRKLFNTSEMHTFIFEKFKAREIEVAEPKRDFPLPTNTDKKGILILLTFQGEKKLSIHQQIQQSLSTFIRETYLIFCFSFRRDKQQKLYKYTPKVDKVILFFIVERNINVPTSYLYIIVKRSDFDEVKDTIIKEIQTMNLNIVGRRYFRNIYPELKNKQDLKEFKIYSFPRIRPYSWTLASPKGIKFDWISQFVV